MPSAFYEIVELHNGDIVLQRSEDAGDPLVCIRFSAESLAYLGTAKFEVAKAMIEAGMDATSEIMALQEEQDHASFNVEKFNQDEFDEEFGEEFSESEKMLLH